MPGFYEFFSGGGMVRAGLGEGWTCLFANDNDEKKCTSYAANWGTDVIVQRDVELISPGDLPSQADLAWASFPCQDLSLAGAGAGLNGERSGTFWPFWNLVMELAQDERPPRLVVLENVPGALSSHHGKDFAAIGEAFIRSGYRFGAMLIDGLHFVPQSRPRLFIIGIKEDISVPSTLVVHEPTLSWHPKRLRLAHQVLSHKAKRNWIWWNLPEPTSRTSVLADAIQDPFDATQWHSSAETERLLTLMSPVNLRKVHKAQEVGLRQIGAVYKRTRRENGTRTQRAEVRFDNISGCLRTPRGGSSRQTIVIVEGEQIRSRLLSSREAARLMGLPETYVLPAKYNEAYHLVGDGVVVPAVRFLAGNLLEPILAADRKTKRTSCTACA